MKKWCRHIWWVAIENVLGIHKGFTWWWKPSSQIDFEQDFAVPRSWKQCPICGAKRPKKPYKPKLNYVHPEDM